MPSAKSAEDLASTTEVCCCRLAETVGRREQDARLGQDSRSDEERAQLGGGMAEVLARLPADLRDVAERLKRDSVS